jgi:peptidoglycan/LPS O-acetylase OafA/YrhL
MEIRRLNTLRGLAALIVVISHFSNETGLWGNALGEGAGQLGVMLFFLLSGFLMTYLYWRKKPTSRNLLSYAVSRGARVLPLYFLVVFFSFVTPHPYHIANIRVLISHLLFLHGNSVLWTISPEIQFYVLFALGWYLVWHRPTILPVLLLGVFVATFLLNYNSGTIEFHGFPITASIVEAIPYFMLGSAFGGLYHQREYLLAYQSKWYLFTLVLLPMLYPNVFIVLFGFEHAMWKDVGILSMMGIVFFCVVFLVPDGNSLLENKPGDFFGKVSYSLYLLHLPLLALLNRIGLAKFGVLSLLGFIFSASIVAWISFNLFEAPSRKAIRAMISQPHADGGPATPAP